MLKLCFHPIPFGWHTFVIFCFVQRTALLLLHNSLQPWPLGTLCFVFAQVQIQPLTKVALLTIHFFWNGLYDIREVLRIPVFLSEVSDNAISKFIWSFCTRGDGTHKGFVSCHGGWWCKVDREMLVSTWYQLMPRWVQIQSTSQFPSTDHRGSHQKCWLKNWLVIKGKQLNLSHGAT